MLSLQRAADVRMAFAGDVDEALAEQFAPVELIAQAAEEADREVDLPARETLLGLTEGRLPRLTLAQFTELIRRETASWRDVIAAADLKRD